MIGWVSVGVLAAAVVGGAAARRVVRRRLRRARDDHSNRGALWNRFYSLDWGETTTNNYGFAPAEGDHPQRFQRQMYLEMLRRLRETREVRPGMRLLEVSCGRGGGLAAILENEPALDATGLDIAESAIDFCRRTYGERDGLRFVAGSALDLPFEDARFDVVLNVEASNDYPDRARFFREVARVLKPDGIFLYTDTFRTGKREQMESDLAAAGFTAEFDDITGNVVEACRLDSPRRREVIRKHAPVLARLMLKPQLENYASIEGSSKFRTFEERRRTYLMTAAEKS